MKSDNETIPIDRHAVVPEQRPRTAWGMPVLLIFVSLIIGVSSILLIQAWPGYTTQQAAVIGQQLPFQRPDGQPFASLTAPVGKRIVYEQDQGISIFASDGSGVRKLNTPGYRYTRGIPPQVTPQHTIVYSGDGIWLTGLDGSPARKLAEIAPDLTITSLALSSDGSRIAWSTVPVHGFGDQKLYVQGLADKQTRVVYRSVAGQCPCFRVFSFAPESNTILYLTNGRNDGRAVSSGLWAIDTQQRSMAQQLLPDEALQKPLALTPQGTHLLYSSFAGYVPWPTDGSVPQDLSSAHYANSLLVASINSNRQKLEGAQTILAEQQSNLTEPTTTPTVQAQPRNTESNAGFQWIAGTSFAPDGQSIAYISFSSEQELPFTRHASLYKVQTQGTSLVPELLARSTARYTELGGWLDSERLVVYADNALYAFDSRAGTVARIVQTGTYAHYIAALE